MYEHDNTFHWQQAKDVANAWQEFFGPAGLGPLPDEIRYFCCAQFVVRRWHIQQHPRQFYLQVRADACNRYRHQSRRLVHLMLNYSFWAIRGAVQVNSCMSGRVMFKHAHCRQLVLQAIHWLDTSPWRGAINPRYSRGLVFETLWHIIMGEEPVMEDPDKKECAVYKCNSSNPTGNKGISRGRNTFSTRHD